ncbi:MAG: hypothetical protein JNK93_07995 [Planctomycetia bacterium]|nr:hypothetical protein [Planctomycetia bacterium]
MRISEALELFGNIPKIRVVLQTLADVGLGYMALGQPAPTMSGGEAQRVKLAAELARPSTGRTLYILDEPTTGLHFDDVRKLLDVLHRLADLGNTVVVVEHNLDVVKSVDWVIDIGPEAGREGGRVVAQGTPEQVVAQAKRPGVVSHTARVLEEVLAAGPKAERKRYDPKAALAAKVGDLDISEVGDDQQLPWEADGRRWHTKDRVTTTGKPAKWDGEVLNFVEERIHALGTFSESNWKHRSIVEIAAKTKSHGWFLHAMTGHEAYLKLVFRVGRGTFKEADLIASLGLSPLSDTPGLEGYSRDGNRVEVATSPGMQTVVVIVHKMADVETKAFQAFLKIAAESFLGLMENAGSSVEEFMPWKKDGEKWHLGEKGFPAGKKLKWDRAALPALLKVLREIEPDIDVKWDSRDHILLKLPGVSKGFAWFRTKEADALVCNLVMSAGLFNLAKLDGFCRHAEFTSDRSDTTQVVRMDIVSPHPLRTPAFAKFMKEYLEGYRKAFG